MKKIIITKSRLLNLQVCVEMTTTDQEILDFCNQHSPSGTQCGWMEVIRELDEYITKEMLPVQCEEYSDRLHLLVSC
jgi:hypothetical protein